MFQNFAFVVAEQKMVEKSAGQDSSGDEDSDDDDETGGKRLDDGTGNGLSKDMTDMTFNEKVGVESFRLETQTTFTSILLGRLQARQSVWQLDLSNQVFGKSETGFILFV